MKHGVHIGNDYGHGKTVRFQCDPGYTFEGKDRVTCNDGKWDADPPNCNGRYRSAFKVIVRNEGRTIRKVMAGGWCGGFWLARIFYVVR